LLNLEVIWTWHREGAGIDGRALRVVGNASDTSRGPIALTSLYSSTFRIDGSRLTLAKVLLWPTPRSYSHERRQTSL